MTAARLLVERAGPLTTVQDAGRPGTMRFGVPRSGPVDRLAHAAACAALGVGTDRPGLELSLGGIVLRCVEGAVSFAVAGEGFAAAGACWTRGTLAAGDTLTVASGGAANWGYLVLAGRLVAPRWLGSSATHALAGLGGGRVQAGQVLVVEDAVEAATLGAFPPPPAISGPFRIVLGPQQRFFAEDALATLVTAAFRTTASFDRMGLVLDGPALTPLSVAMPSEPLVRGAIQVDGAGVASILSADHQTTGGYPKIATVIGPDADRLAQCPPGSEVRFQAIEPDEAIAAARAYRAEADRYLADLRAEAPLDARLRAANLVSGVVSATETGTARSVGASGD